MPTLTRPRIMRAKYVIMAHALAPAPRRRFLWPALAVLAGLLLFCHGCHGNEDTELFAVAQQKSPRGIPVGFSVTADNHGFGTRISMG
jgi:hypothetical protein